MNETDLLPTAAQAEAMLRSAIGQMDFARRYTIELLEATPRDLWYERPDGLETHIAWQVAHLTVSEYGLLMFRIRGRRPADLEVIPGRFRKAYSRSSTPSFERSSQPSVEELLERFEQVHRTALIELKEVDPEALLEPVEMPYAAFPIKLGAVLFAPLHEHTHAGQIGLIRRSFGLDPIR